eukprot:1735213-Rhodomonas_salina.1
MMLHTEHPPSDDATIIATTARARGEEERAREEAPGLYALAHGVPEQLFAPKRRPHWRPIH